MNVMQHIFPCLCVIKLYTTNKFCNLSHSQPCDKWFPVTTAWRVLRLRMEERHPIWRVAANKLNKRSRTADKGWSSSLGVWRGANNTSPWKSMLSNIHKARRFLWRQNNPEVNYSPIRIFFPGGRGVFLEEVPRSRILFWKGVVGTGWSWLRIGTCGGHLWVRWWNFGFQKCGEFLD